MHDQYLTVTALTKYIKRKLSGDPHLKTVWLRGEISNFKHHSRGHMYLSLKDEQARIQAVMFAGNNRTLKFLPENGMNVLVKGEINVYEPMGQYQLYIKEMQPDGIGALYFAFEQLKEKLEKEGLFALERKKNLPTYPKHIGVITSPTGAAVRDIITTINRRYPIVPVTVLPVLVQGERASSSIVNAIQYANKHMDVDVLIVGRGGGSIEDLWGFNEEIVARAIADSEIPVISAVGHETDTTISDFAADLRAATPTGAAELAVPSIVELREQVKTLRDRLERVMSVQETEAKQKLERLKKSYAFKYPEQLMRQKEQDLDRVLERLTREMRQVHKNCHEQWVHVGRRLRQQGPEMKMAEGVQALDRQTRQLHNRFHMLLQQKKERFHTNIDKLTLVNPLDIMKRGFAIPFNEKGNVIKSTVHVSAGEPLSLKIQDGRVECRVTDVKEDENGRAAGSQL
ncbi:exodeoxyribonuclease VII large subunit [Halobacillus karajensis]|uniref:Exodeoxyribonuclease 7 large subunit n=1 Tax=Halobacillus karajensis TaxID=195088 RepID=A0A024P5I2_9BACI|nr:exodeoxyribonuclease VII large subunit [Halobacillus karajensis]CDQ17893.1 Exodeoxyribonuclease 7 large subunit [Halobacillus karajensis]CDQ24299.1 Exodeoxyribonuclease 7 large subunit [Halobacillus karajensis]CDQ29452.1 Exodeoxyribonuclease 7 large subunit [Halobacillus karajensis]